MKKMEPPDILYYGTDPDVVPKIFEEGLKPMSMQYIHLSLDIKTAKISGTEKCKFPALLVINALRAYKEGINFYLDDRNIWMSDYIPSKYIM